MQDIVPQATWAMINCTKDDDDTYIVEFNGSHPLQDFCAESSNWNTTFRLNDGSVLNELRVKTQIFCQDNTRPDFSWVSNQLLLQRDFPRFILCHQLSLRSSQLITTYF